MNQLLPNQLEPRAPRNLRAGADLGPSLPTTARGPTVASTMRIHYRDRLFSRSCLETSPASPAAHRLSFSVAVRASDRTHSPLHQLKQKLLQASLGETTAEVWFKPICAAANQAAGLAWESPCPLLVFPCLFEELVQAVRGSPPQT